MKKLLQTTPLVLKYLPSILVSFCILVRNESRSQTLCNPPIPFNAGTDATIPCGGTVNLGEVPTPPQNNPIAPSCTTPGQLTQGGGIYINNVSTTGGINGNNISNLNTLVGGIDPMGPNAWQSVWYSNYTTQIVESAAGGTFQLNLSGQSLYRNPPYSFRIWIDWNNDGTFDNTPGGELVHTTALTTSNPLVFNSILINVPAGQQPGIFRMRIRAKDNAPFVSSDNACTYNNSQGITAPYAGYTGNQTGAYWFSSEIEDYGVKISGTSSGAGGNYTYSWTPAAGLNNPNVSNPIATPVTTTTYTVTVTDPANNCITTEEVTVTVTTVIPTFVNPGPVCSGTNFLLPSRSNEGITGSWSPAVNNMATTTYTFTPDGGQCAVTAQMTVAITPETEPVFDNPGPVCSGTPFSLPAVSNNGISGSWSPAINNTATTTYTFTPDHGMCASATTMTVVIDNQVMPSFTNPGPVCPGTSFTLPVISNNGISGSWSPAINNMTTTTYTFTPDQVGCVASASMTVVVTNQVAPSFTNPGPVCSGVAFSLPAVSENGINGSWSPAINNTATTTYTFTPDQAGCASSLTLTVVIDNPAIPSFTNPGPLCPGTSFSLPMTSDNGISGSWSPAINNTMTTDYLFIPENIACAVSSTMTVVINPGLEISLSGGANVCSGESILPVTITATGGTAPYTFIYSVGSYPPVTLTSGQNTAIIDLNSYMGTNANIPSCYDITVEGSAGACQTVRTFTDYFCIHPKPNASFTLQPGNGGIYSMTNTSTGASSYEWDYGDYSGKEHTVNTTHRFPDKAPSHYTVELVAFNDKGCSDTTHRIISIEEELIFYVPNAFTPDGDRYNNVFKPVMTSGYDPFNFQLEIYDRWGECIFVSNNSEIGWDGTYNGNMVQDDTYLWKIAFKLRHNDDRKTYNGHVTLIR